MNYHCDEVRITRTPEHVKNLAINRMKAPGIEGDDDEHGVNALSSHDWPVAYAYKDGAAAADGGGNIHDNTNDGKFDSDNGGETSAEKHRNWFR